MLLEADNLCGPQILQESNEDNEYALYTVTLFNRDADNFQIKAHEREFQIRDFEYISDSQESRKQELDKLMQEQESLKKLSFSRVLYQLWRGFYFLDAFLCSSLICRVHCEIRVTPFLFVRYTVTICEK